MGRDERRVHRRGSAVRYGGTSGEVHRAARYRDRECGEQVRAGRVAQADRRRVGPGSPPDRARSARRYAAATGLARTGSAYRGSRCSPDRGDLRAGLCHIAAGLADAVAELQELSRGIHPAILSGHGLGPAVRTLARRSAVPVDLDVSTNARFPEPLEIAAYYVASEALANAMKHAQASRVEMSLSTRDGSLLLSIRDDGIGGADPARGSGLAGLANRVEALGGSIRLHSAAGAGTQITVDLPLEYEPAQGPADANCDHAAIVDPAKSQVIVAAASSEAARPRPAPARPPPAAGFLVRMMPCVIDRRCISPR